MGYTRLNHFVAPKKICGFGPVSKKNRLNLSSEFRGGGGKHVREGGKMTNLFLQLNLEEKECLSDIS